MEAQVIVFLSGSPTTFLKELRDRGVPVVGEGGLSPVFAIPLTLEVEGAGDFRQWIAEINAIWGAGVTEERFILDIESVEEGPA